MLHPVRRSVLLPPVVLVSFAVPEVHPDRVPRLANATRAEEHATTTTQRRADGALAGTASSLLLVGLAATAANLGARLCLGSAQSHVRLLRHHLALHDVCTGLRNLQLNRLVAHLLSVKVGERHPDHLRGGGTLHADTAERRASLQARDPKARGHAQERSEHGWLRDGPFHA